ncbi:hypothetical protein, partial [Ruminococcus sp.]|uniref:hypothetical protein n=1 Tax=Ruminococcus sp. TaxID=41978 RepID=UPI00261A082F
RSFLILFSSSVYFIDYGPLPSWGKTPSDEQLDSIMPWSATLPETCHRTYHQIVENEAVVE